MSLERLLVALLQWSVSNSYGNGINASGQVTGYSDTISNQNDGNAHAFVTNSNGQMSDLGTLGGGFSTGQGINDSGQVTGYSITANGHAHAFITNSDGQMIDLGTLVGGSDSYGNGINASGQVTGTHYAINSSYNPIQHAFVTDNGVMRDLNTLLVDGITDWVLNDARGINDAGQITGTGVHNGLTRAFVLTPVSAVPVPGAVWLFTSGLSLLAFTRRRKAQNIRLHYC